MDRPAVVVPPPLDVGLTNYPVLVAVTGVMFFLIIMLLLAKYVDPTHGPLTISLALVITFAGAVAFAMRFTIPQDAETGTLIGTLVLAIGSVVSYWLTRRSDRDQ